MTQVSQVIPLSAADSVVGEDSDKW